jgi:hypothetical protein
MMCKFYHECEYASSEAFTCTEGAGGNYCGKYRMLLFGYEGCRNVPKELEYASSTREILA